ncbi:MAG: MBOAT family protein [Clostridiales bacterium]|jgi:D-alanyl-lipoteichoic acid acyltransferase DltB (MBOAT superfamily)|nr:MBOAT family protein [Clostridiales bacterium]
MLFNSSLFIVFFITVVLIYFLSPHKLRWGILLVASCIFYMAWNPAFIMLVVFSAFSSWFASLQIHKFSDKPAKRKTILIISLLISFGVLFVFKYLGFINESIADLLSMLGVEFSVSKFSIILPLGISFFTFQAVGYTVDVYGKKTVPEKKFFKYLLFIAYFPQLVAGPIERYESLAPQLFGEKSEKKFNIDNLIIGIKFMAFGFFKKIVIADRIAVAVNTVFNAPHLHGGLAFVIASVLFTFQIYCDFSGYSDIALGCSKVLGIDITQNFRQPFFSKNIREFWQRWHISLSFWFRDYLYIPLGGSRCSSARKYFNVFITFLISGIWHGANWTFAIWGALHWVFQLFSDLIHGARKKIVPDIFGRISTFCLVSFAFIFFRANSVADAFYIVRNLFSDFSKLSDMQYIFFTLNGFGFTFFELIVSICFIIFLSVADGISGKENIHSVLERKSFALRFAFYIFIFTSILVMGVYDNASDFIYFQF